MMDRIKDRRTRRGGVAYLIWAPVARWQSRLGFPSNHHRKTNRVADQPACTGVSAA